MVVEAFTGRALRAGCLIGEVGLLLEVVNAENMETVHPYLVSPSLHPYIASLTYYFIITRPSKGFAQ